MKINGISAGTVATDSPVNGIAGPAVSADNTVSRFDGINSKTVQGSLVIVDDSGSINIPMGQAYKIDGASHVHAGSDLTSGTVDGDRLPAISTTKLGAVPATGTPAGKYLKDDGTWATVSAGGTTTERLAPITASIAFATGDADAGKSTSVDLTANYGRITRIRLYADWIAGQQTNWTALINSASTGLVAGGTSLVFDNAVGAVAAGDYLIADNEILYNSSGTATPLTITRGKKGTTDSYHDDNVQVRKANDGIRIEFYPNSSYNPKEMFFQWRGINTGKWVTDAAITAGAKLITLVGNPAVLSDFGYGDLVMIDEAVDEYCRVQDVYGDVVAAAVDYSISTIDALSAHDITKNVYRVCEFDVPIPFKLDSAGTVLYCKVHVDEKISATVNINMEIIVDKFS